MDIEELIKVTNATVIDSNFDRIIDITRELLTELNINQIKCRKDMIKSLEKICRKHKLMTPLIKILAAYRLMVANGELQYDSNIELLLRTKVRKSLSGIVSNTVFMSPYPDTSNGIQEFSCEYDCAYCPKEPNQPRSYLLKEPGVLRANANKFIATDQFWDRAKSLILMGHPYDKIELIVSGGTFSSYPREYVINFFRDLFYAANTTYDKIANRPMRDKLDLDVEQNINTNTSNVKIIGLTIETRPDRINLNEIIFFRHLGITRVQIGVQHLNDDILRHINRKCTNAHTIKAIRALKESGFKVDIHLMPDLPTPYDMTLNERIELDRKMFLDVMTLNEYQADQWKIYPCETVDWTSIKEWYDNHTYKPYAEITNSDGSNPLFELILWVKTQIPPWIRLNRIVRDIPNSYILGGNRNTSMRSNFPSILTQRHQRCRCIRCREVGSKKININDFSIKIRTYSASEGTEYFISWENSEEILLGFCRLRINQYPFNNKYFPELNGCALIRELHIYGQTLTHDDNLSDKSVQHKGLGKQLIEETIKLTQLMGLTKIAVIAGIGVRNYYIKQGFLPTDLLTTNGKYLIKHLSDTIDSSDTKCIDQSTNNIITKSNDKIIKINTMVNSKSNMNFEFKTFNLNNIFGLNNYQLICFGFVCIFGVKYIIKKYT